MDSVNDCSSDCSLSIDGTGGDDKQSIMITTPNKLTITRANSAKNPTYSSSSGSCRRSNLSTSSSGGGGSGGGGRTS
ncbi:hypothetical protein BLA29_014507, partial [Euroglyphus maynei]